MQNQLLNQTNSCGIPPEDHMWKVLWDLSHHVAVERRWVLVHHEQKLIHGLVKWGNQPSHHTIQILKLPLPICHLPHHGSQCCPLDHKRITQHMFGAPVKTHLCTMAAMAADTDPPPGAAVRAPTLLTNCCRDRDTRRLSSCDFTMYLHRFDYHSRQPRSKHSFLRISAFSHAAIWLNSLYDPLLWVEWTKRVKAEFADHLCTDENHTAVLQKFLKKTQSMMN